MSWSNFSRNFFMKIIYISNFCRNFFVKIIQVRIRTWLELDNISPNPKSDLKPKPDPKKNENLDGLKMCSVIAGVIKLLIANKLWRNIDNCKKNPHLLRSFRWSNVHVDFFKFFSIEFAACSKPPSRDNHRKASYPKTQQRDQGAGWTHMIRLGSS